MPIKLATAINQDGGSVSVLGTGEIVLSTAAGLPIALLFAQDPAGFNKLIRLGSGNPGGASGNAYLEFAAPSGFGGNFLSALVNTSQVFLVNNAGVITAGGLNLQGTSGITAGGFNILGGNQPSNFPGLIVSAASGQTGEAFIVEDEPAQNNQFAIVNVGTGAAPQWALEMRVHTAAESMVQAHALGAYTGFAVRVVDDSRTLVGWLPIYA